MTNENLRLAKMRKNDEFYTRYEDIENELVLYKKFLFNKIVYCNCDTLGSNFVNYFIKNYKNLSLRGLIFTSIHSKEKYFYDGEWLKHETMNDYGDFRSPECVELLKQSDIVITNPPFSLFREYFNQLIEYKKDFLILGNMNSFVYKNIFPYFKEGYLKSGFNVHNKPMSFYNHNKETKQVAVSWFTNLKINKESKLDLIFSYSPEKYPKYDNYNAIEVKSLKEIPYDYDGIMGVPITYALKDYSDTFKVVGMSGRGNLWGLKTKTYSEKDGDNWRDLDLYPLLKNNTNKNYNHLYTRIFIQRINPVQSQHQNS